MTFLNADELHWAHRISVGSFSSNPSGKGALLLRELRKSTSLVPLDVIESAEVHKGQSSP